MADVTIKYKGSTIAEMNGTGSKTLNTSGTYCEGNVEVAYAPHTKTYEITLAKSSGWVLLTTLDNEVLAHINDPNFLVTLSLTGAFEYVYYTATFGCATNTQQSSQNGYPVYGTSLRKTTETSMQVYAVYYPANNTSTSTGLGGAQFRVNGSNYYFRPADGYIHAGTYRLTFTW